MTTAQDISATDALGAGALSLAGFSLGYLTPIGGVIVMALVVLIVIDIFADSGGAATGAFAAGIGKIASLAWSPIDKATSTARRVWLWRVPFLATLVGFLLAWGQNMAERAS